METHNLVVTSKRDIQVACACGRWSMIGPTFDRQTDAEIDERINREFEAHVRREDRASRVDATKGAA